MKSTVTSNIRVDSGAKSQASRRRAVLPAASLPDLARVLDDWLSTHPGGQHRFVKPRSLKALEDKTARDAFAAALRGSRWEILRGFHVFRHSFASNLARHGTDQRIIDNFMGHQTEEMRNRYQHLFPEDTAKALSVLKIRLKPFAATTDYTGILSDN